MAIANTNDAFGPRLTYRCHECGEWNTAQQMLCSGCRAPIVTMVPPSRRPVSVTAFLIALAVIVTALIVGIRALIA